MLTLHKVTVRHLPCTFVVRMIIRLTQDLVMAGHYKIIVQYDFELIRVRMIVMKVKATAGEVQPNPC